MQQQRHLTLSIPYLVGWVALAPLVALTLVSPEVWADYLRVFAVAGAGVGVYVTVEVFVAYYRNVWPEAKGQPHRVTPVELSLSGIAYILLLTVALQRVHEQLGNPISPVVLPPVLAAEALYLTASLKLRARFGSES